MGADQACGDCGLPVSTILTDQSIFPELTFEETQIVHGMQVTFAINQGNKVNSRALLEKFGMPFEKEGGKR